MRPSRGGRTDSLLPASLLAQYRLELLWRKDLKFAVLKPTGIASYDSIDGFHGTGLDEHSILKILDGRFNRSREDMPVHCRDLEKSDQIEDRRPGRLSPEALATM